MKHRHPYGALATLCVEVFFLTTFSAQESTHRPRIPVVQDWSQGKIIFTRDGLLQHPELLSREPRVLHQAMQRWQGPNSDIFPAIDSKQTAPTSALNHQDWNVNLKGRLSPHMFPSKFSFDVAAPPSCANDYVVFGTTAKGVTGGASNLVAFNNLYSGNPVGICGANPTVLFAYNITTPGSSGNIVTSPVLSADGKKIAFVESETGIARFHVLTWTAGQGDIASAAAPTMTSLTYSPAADNTSSSPWVDYANDIAYVGSDAGKMYKITGVFKGTPALAGAPWPVTVSPNFHLGPPVLDARRGMLMVGSVNGNLYQINAATGVLNSLTVGVGPNRGILGTPIVDITNGTTFVVSANDGTSGVLVEVDTATLGLLAKARIGLASANPANPAVNLYQPAFSNSYFTDPSTGLVRLCGTASNDINPWQYAFGFTGRIMKTTAAFSQQLLTSTAARCTGWTEFLNPNIGAGGTDFFFFGLTQDCTGPGFGGGCVAARISDTVLATATLNGGPSGIVVDNFSTAAQASSIYLTEGRVNKAFKFSQNLQ